MCVYHWKHVVSTYLQALRAVKELRAQEEHLRGTWPSLRVRSCGDETAMEMGWIWVSRSEVTKSDAARGSSTSKAAWVVLQEGHWYMTAESKGDGLRWVWRGGQGLDHQAFRATWRILAFIVLDVHFPVSTISHHYSRGPQPPFYWLFSSPGLVIPQPLPLLLQSWCGYSR